MGRSPIPARRQPVLKSEPICSAKIPSPVIRVRHCELFSLPFPRRSRIRPRSEEHTSELQSLAYLVCRLLLEKKNNTLLQLYRDSTDTHLSRYRQVPLS